MGDVAAAKTMKVDFTAVVCPIGTIKEHHAFAKLAIKEPVEFNTAASTLQPICISETGVVFRGFATLEEARKSAMSHVNCLKFLISNQECLRQLLMFSVPTKGLNAFCRTSLALELEGELREKAAERQREGGRTKLPSNLTEARIDVRNDIAAIAHVSTGNVTKVKKILSAAPAEVLDALKNGELSIHRAFTWQQLNSTAQRQGLMRYRAAKGIRKTIQNLLSQQSSSAPALEVKSLVTALERLPNEDMESIEISAVRLEGRQLIASEELVHLLESQARLSR